MVISRQKETRSRDYALLLFRMTSRALYSARYHRQHCTLHAFEQFGALYMHSHDDEYPLRPAWYPQVKASADTYGPSGPASIRLKIQHTHHIAGTILNHHIRRLPSILAALRQRIVYSVVWWRNIITKQQPESLLLGRKRARSTLEGSKLARSRCS